MVRAVKSAESREVQMTYKLLIVDDEKVVRDRVVSLLDWETAGFEVIGSCENGLEAMEILEKDCPDLIMTDIRMPFMDGLELAGFVQRNYPMVKLVFLTGFDDFNYARKAIDLSVMDYLLKPITADELSESLKRIRERLDKQLAERRDLSLLRDYYEQSLPQLRSGFLTQLINGNLQPRQIEESIRTLKITELEGNLFRVAVLKIDEASFSHGVFSHGDQALASFGVFNITEEICSKHESGVAFIQADQVVVIAPVDEDTKSIRSLNDGLEEIRLAVSRFLQLTLTIGISSTVSMEDIRLGWQEAMRALEYHLVVGNDQLIYLEDLEHVEVRPPVVSKDLEKKLLTAIKVAHDDDLREAVEQIMQIITSSQWPLDYVRFYLSGIAAALISEAAATGVDLSETLPVDQMTQYLTRSSLSDISSWLVETSRGLMTAIERGRRDNCQLLVEKANAYLEENYAERDLSLNSISSHLHISPSYFGAVYKRETGETFVSALLKIRMERARDLMLTTGMKNFEIASQVGYDDPHYFSVCFKKYFRMSPNEFKSSQLNQGPGGNKS
jgi:two-component system response regulator YesN